MKRFLEKILPHLSVALSITIVFVVYLDSRNPMMEFLFGTPFFLLCIANLVVSVALGFLRYLSRACEKDQNKEEKNPDNV